MDSLTAMEVKQLLEREFGVFLTPKEILNLTFACLNSNTCFWQLLPSLLCYLGTGAAVTVVFALLFWWTGVFKL
jgi:hypothetical protein